MQSIKLLKIPIITASIMLYVLLSIGSLLYFPSMHSDEGWLASLSRTILTDTNINTTEDFFHEVSRKPHAIKLLFHLLQMPFISISFTLLSVRLLSLIAGLISLGFLFKSALLLFNDKIAAYIFVILIAIDIQFIYISHFARQEIFILMIFSICLYIFIKPSELWQFKKDFFIGGLLGISIGIHPNIFIIATGFVFLYFSNSIVRLKRKNSKSSPSFLNSGLLLVILSLFGIFYIAISIIINPDFISTYLSFGQEVGVTKPFIIKILKLPRFFGKMFFRIGGTYYLPDIRPQLIIFAGSFLALIPAAFFVTKKRAQIICIQFLMLGIITGILIIGKYSPPSIIFIFIPGYLLFVMLIQSFIYTDKKIILIFIILLLSSFIFSYKQIIPWIKVDYNKYIYQIKKDIPENSKTLGNLNTVFAFSPGSLYSYRDLEVLNPDFNFFDYIKKHKIEYIIYTDELKIIFEERPVWNTMYGNIYPWYEEMMEFIKTNCEEIITWNESVFGMRITSYMNKRGGDITIYKVLSQD